jgi:hypothetical protein
MMLFIFWEDDLLYLCEDKSSDDFTVKIYANGFLLIFNSYSAFVLATLLLEDRETFFLCSA